MIVIELQKCLKHRHNCRDVPTNASNHPQTFFSSRIVTQNPQIRVKYDPIVDRISLTAPVTRHPLIPIDSNQRKLSRNDPQILKFSFSINSTRHSIIINTPSDPEFIANQSDFIANRLELYHMPPNRLRLVANRLQSS